ncbi:MAG: glycosyltransferase family 1 protein [Bacteroidia bacterium]|nr:glycosyltransferase family 1 protein [Bacteroidia bacterium]
MKILFIGETWLGSCARSMKEALSKNSDIELDELSEEFIPKVRSLGLRVLHRLTYPFYRREFNWLVLDKVHKFCPDFLMTYKGNFVQKDLLRELLALGVKTVNVYPDYSPHAYGISHREAVGQYDLVISTKAYHPEIWREVYGYQNRCKFVPQGYDPQLHLFQEAPVEFTYDVVMISTYRREYGRLILDFARALGQTRLKVAIGGHGWNILQDQLPETWHFPGAIQGRGYMSLLRSGKICIAPLTRHVVIDGKSQPGDVDTTRTYELAAGHCFFIHQRTDFARELYEPVGVPFFDDGEELAAQVLRYLDLPHERSRIAEAAHKRAVPLYSTDARASAIKSILYAELISPAVDGSRS